jgi:ribosome-associated protein
MKESLARDLEPRSEAEQLSSSEVAYEIVAACSDAQGRDLNVLEVSQIFPLSDFFVVVSGRSDRHVQGIANRILENLSQRGVSPLTIEGVEKGHWVLLDYGDVVVHIFYGPSRAHYDVESLWVRARQVSLSRTKAGKVRIKKVSPAVRRVHKRGL